MESRPIIRAVQSLMDQDHRVPGAGYDNDARVMALKWIAMAGPANMITIGHLARITTGQGPEAR